MYTAKKAIELAKAELDYHEKASNASLDSKTANSGSNNWTKYARDLHNAGYYNGNKNGYAWCDQFFDWLMYQLCGKDKAKAEYIECQTGDLGAGCTYSKMYYEKAGRFDKSPKLGDQIFFLYDPNDSGADHTGIVVELTADKVITIEGNKGDKVSRCTYNRNDSTIIGYGHPRYDAEPEQADKPKAKTVTVELPVLRRGDTGASVKAVQRILRQRGYVGTDGKLIVADGDYGKETEAAVTRFQDNRGAKNPTGIVGEWTWNKLLKG